MEAVINFTFTSQALGALGFLKHPGLELFYLWERSAFMNPSFLRVIDLKAPEVRLAGFGEVPVSEASLHVEVLASERYLPPGDLSIWDLQSQLIQYVKIQLTFVFYALSRYVTHPISPVTDPISP
ncbi:hypothetical protein J6590_055234 [Homalodisca vitripennis]|nr:hypothetical protein J6590_055234 [Homalodisca vitripennis]